MDISAFFPLTNPTNEDLAIEEYKKTIFNLANKGYIMTNQYSFFLNFVKINGSICNLKWMLKQIASLKPLDKNKNDTDIGTDTDENIVDFKKALAKTFNRIFKYKPLEDDLRINKNIKYYLTRCESIDLTREQKNAMHTLYDFMIDDSQKTMGLYGYAGSGKTTTVVEFVSYMLQNRYLHTIAFSAPTNKALNVIKGKFKPHLRRIIETCFKKELGEIFNFEDEIDYLDQNGICIKFLTIHKLLNYQTDFSLDGERIFVRDERHGSLIEVFELVIIDECSMINMDMIDSLFEEIRNMSKQNSVKSKGYTMIPKIVFSGDPAQLPPVNEEDSSIFCKNKDELPFAIYMQTMSFKYANSVTSDVKALMKYKYKLLIDDLEAMKTLLLKKVVRSRIDNVTNVCHEFRKWITSLNLPAFEKYKDVKGVSFFNHDQTISKIQSDWFKKFLESIKSGDTSIIITWTNKQTDIYNDTIRRQIFKGKTLQKFEPNDVLMLSDFYGLDLGDKFCKQTLYTSEQIKVISTKLVEIPINSFQMISNTSLKNMKQAVKIEGQLKVLIEGLNEFFCKNVKFMCWVLDVHKFGEETNNKMKIIVVDDSAIEKYNDFKTKSSLAIKNFSKQMLNAHRSAPKQIERLLIKPLWKQWNQIYVETFANVNYGYSITCHKAQGSSFYNVYMDLHDILENKKVTEAKKCAYTGATRTINELNILI